MSVPPDETHGMLQPMRRWYPLSVSSGEREAMTKVTSCALRWATEPSNESAANVQPEQPAGVFGP